MTREHVRFGLLSDLHDEVMDAARKESVLDHLRDCSTCDREYREIGRMVRMVSCLRSMCIHSGDDFTRATLSRIIICEKKRKRQVYYKRMIPSSVAAMVIFLVGIDQFQNSPTGTRPGAVRMAAGSGSGEILREIGSAYDMRRTISILKKNRARVTMVTDSYIEAEASSLSIDTIQRECEGSVPAGMHGFATAVGYTEGGMQDGMVLSSGFMQPRTGDPSRNVRVRINLR